MGLFSKIYGTVSGLFQIGGPAGPGWLDDSGNIDARNSTNDGYVNVRGADPVNSHDLITLSYGNANYTGGGGGAAGTSLINFGSFPGECDATVTVTGQTTITSAAIIEAWLYPLTTSDHSADEHRVEQIDVFANADSIVSGSGFTIYARTRNDRLYGQWNCAWLWSAS